VTYERKALAGQREGDGMRKPILAFVTVAIVVAAAQPAGAIDNGLRGQYRAIERPRVGSHCGGSSRHRVEVRYVNERVREIGPVGSDSGKRLRYVRGERFPWQHEGRLVLRYRPRTDSAVGVRYGLEDCSWRVRLVPLG
jgi:hypothetical protein